MKVNPLRRWTPRRFGDANMTRTGVSRSFRIEIHPETRAAGEACVFVCDIKLQPDSEKRSEAAFPKGSTQTKNGRARLNSNCGSKPRQRRENPLIQPSMQRRQIKERFDEKTL
jgi:hypothetical protein